MTKPVRVDLPTSQLKTSILSKNLCSLSCSRPDLAEWILCAQQHHGLRLFVDQQGFVNGEYLHNRQFRAFHPSRPESEVTTHFGDLLHAKYPICLLGSGLGYGLKYLLRQTQIPKIVLYERDLYLLRVVLTLHDFARELLRERLVIVEQGNLSEITESKVVEIVPEPVFFRRNEVEYLTLSRVPRECHRERKRAVLLSGSQLFTTDCATTLYDFGWDVFEVDPTFLTAEMTHAALDRLNPDFVFKVNHLHGIEQFARNRAVVEWEIDPSASPAAKIADEDATELFVFSHNPDRVETLRRSGHPHVEYLPLCANLIKFSPAGGRRKPEYGSLSDLSFVGSLMLENHKSLLSSLLSELTRLVEVEGGGWLDVKQWLENLINHPPDVAKFNKTMCSIETVLARNGLPESVSINGRQVLIRLPVAEWFSYHWRKQVIQALLPFGPKLWGHEEWRLEFPDQYQGFADHYLDLPQIYRGSKINLDIARLYQPNIVTMRVFDGLACGAFVLAHRNESLLELFREDVEIVCYSSVEEASDKIGYYLKHDARRLEIARNGHEKVVQCHTFRHRIEQVLKVIGMQPATGLSSQSVTENTLADQIL